MALKGRDLILKIGDNESTEAFVVVGGCRTNTLTWNTNPVDTTCKESNGFQELLSDAGVAQVTISLDGLFKLDSRGPFRFTMATFDDLGTTFDPVSGLSTSHGWSVDERVRVSSDGTLPAPLTEDTDYWLSAAVTSNFKLSATRGGSDIDITTTGTGNHTIRIWSGADQFREIALARTLNNYRLTFGDLDVLEGPFVIEDYQRGGPHDDAESFTATIRRQDASTWTPASQL